MGSVSVTEGSGEEEELAPAEIKASCISSRRDTSEAKAMRGDSKEGERSCPNHAGISCLKSTFDFLLSGNRSTKESNSAPRWKGAERRKGSVKHRKSHLINSSLQSPACLKDWPQHRVTWSCRHGIVRCRTRARGATSTQPLGAREEMVEEQWPEIQQPTEAPEEKQLTPPAPERDGKMMDAS